MALARFFDKTALSAATLLRGFDRQGFEDKLASVTIGFSFDVEEGKSVEQLTAIEMVVNLLARLYPRLALVSGSSEILANMEALARSINPLIEISPALAGSLVVVATHGLLRPLPDNVPLIYLGAEGWVAKVAVEGPLPWGRTNNVFGAAVAACLAVANVFRHVFKDQLEEAELDHHLELNLLDYSTGLPAPTSSDFGQLTVGETTLIGIGAIGNAVVWTLARLKTIGGSLCLVDHENVDLSNLQRYVLTNEGAIGKSKVEWAASALSATTITVRPVATKWAEFLGTSDYRFPLIAAAVDTKEERIRISGALAKEVLNAWTQTQEVGISRHQNYGTQACLACLYFPQGTVPSDDQLIGSAVGLPGEAVRDLLSTGKAVGPDFIRDVATRIGVAPDTLMRFQSKSLRQFYSDAICGGTVLRLGAGTPTGTEVPMAFQSALAGVFLAAEIVISANQLRTQPLCCVSRLQTLRTTEGMLNAPIAAVSRCLCQDPVFVSVYREKYTRI